MKLMLSIALSVFCVSRFSEVYGQSPNEYPLYKKEEVKYNGDWLIEDVGVKTNIYRTLEGNLVLSNGLISRIFEVNKGGATIGIENLMTGENMVRSVRPEAEIEVNGIKIPVGGLIGQPIHNYLLDEWIEEMKVDPAALKLQRYELGDTEPRLEWKKRLEWMPKDVDWPAPGKRLTFTYGADSQLISYLADRINTDEGREKLFFDDFRILEGHWEVYVSDADERNSFVNEGKPGEIMALANQHVVAEVRSPRNAKVWIVELDPGTDKSSTWGPGMALETTDGRVYKFNLRPGDQGFGVFDGKREMKIGQLESGKKVYLRAEMKDSGLSFSYSYEGEVFEELYFINIGARQIEALRIGKMDAGGEFGDHSQSGERGRSDVVRVQILGDLQPLQRGALLSKLDYLRGIKVKIHYEMYDGIPLLSKWIEVENASEENIMLDRFKSEILALVEAESEVDSKGQWIKPNITVETDYRFGGMSSDNLYSSSVAWNTDPDYKTQVNYQFETPVLLEVYPKLGPAKTLLPGEHLESFRTWELFHDSRDRERIGLAEKRMYRSQSPWVVENPIMMHVRNADNASVKKAIDQCAEVGFEMVIMTFGSGFQIEDESQENLERMKELADYAHSKGVALGGYSLLASRRISEEDDVVMPEGLQPRFGNSPCLESDWGIGYFKKLYNFYEKTGQDILEHDGSYPGDLCASRDHPGHHGLEDSQWNQYETIRTFYEWCRGRGIFLNVPDYYFMAGATARPTGHFRGPSRK